MSSQAVGTVTLGTQVTTAFPIIGPSGGNFPNGTPATALVTVLIINGQPPVENSATLPLNSWIVDPLGEYVLVFDSTGVCLYQVIGTQGTLQNGGSFNGMPLWGPFGANGQYFCAQNDGNLVVYNADGTANWSNGSKGTAQLLCLQSDSNLVLYHFEANWSRIGG